jgi:uncharacterized membrane protein YbhN (UPF0104 family)
LVSAVPSEPVTASSGAYAGNGRSSALRILVKLGVSAALMALLLARSDTGRLWRQARAASPAWLTVALALYFAMILVSAWRWSLLLRAQRVAVPGRQLVTSFLVATFFNNFLPSNIGGDVVRIRDTAGAAGSRTAATLIVAADRALGLLGLLLVAAFGATLAGSIVPGPRAPIWPPLLWAALAGAAILFALPVAAPGAFERLLRPLRRINPEWVDLRLQRTTSALTGFRRDPGAVLTCFAGAVVVQAVLVAFYAAIARSLSIPISALHLAVIVPVSFLVQMLPVSLNGFGVREATFSYYFVGLKLPLESGLVLSLMGAGLMLLVSLSGAAVYAARR